MKKINFNYIELENFLSFKEKQKFEFEGNGITLLLGKNGAGKSSIASGLYYALFGKSDRGLISNLINNNVNKSMKIKLNFSINKDNYTIIRGIKPNIFEIYINNKKMEINSSIKEQQKVLNEILGFNELIFNQLIYLGTNLSKQKNFLELNQKEKEEVFNILIDLTEIKNLEEKTKKYKNFLKNQINNKNDIKKIIENDIKNIKESIQEQEKQNDEIIKNKNKILNEIKNDINILEKKLKNIKIKKINLNKLQNKFKKLKNEYNELKHKKLIYEENEKSKIICPNCGIEIKKELNFDINEIINNMNELKNEIINLKEKIEKEKQIEKENIKKEFEIKHIKENIKKLKEKYNSIENMKEIQIDYSILNQKENDLKQLNNELIKLNNEYEECNELLILLSNENIKGKYIDEYIPILNYYINYYLEKLNFNYKFIFDKNFKEQIFINEKELSFESLSNGQKMRIIIAILFSFLKIIELKSNINFNILFLDEFINGSLDNDGIEDILNSLIEFSKEKEIILITHNDNIKQKDELFSRIFEIQKNEKSEIKNLKIY